MIEGTVYKLLYNGYLFVWGKEIFGTERLENEEYRRLHNEEIQDLYHSLNHSQGD